MAALVTWRGTGLLTRGGRANRGWRPAPQPGDGRADDRRGGGRIGVVRAAGQGVDRWSDPAGSAVDAVTAAGLLGVSQLNLRPADRVTWLNWVPWSFAENVICGQAMAGNPIGRRIAGGGLVAATHLLQGPRLGDRVANGVAHTAFFTVAAGFADQIRAGAVRLDRAQAAAVAEGEALAAARERAVQLRLLLDAPSRPSNRLPVDVRSDHDSVRLSAGREADELERNDHSVPGAGGPR